MKTVLFYLVNGGSTSKAMNILYREGYEVRRTIHNQVSQSCYSEERGRYVTHQWNPTSIHVAHIDDPYDGFEYNYTPSREELMELLERVINNGIHSGVDLEVTPEVV